jgi:hypothetical protein
MESLANRIQNAETYRGTRRDRNVLNGEEQKGNSPDEEPTTGAEPDPVFQNMI